MSLIITFLVGLLGGSIAFLLELPLPWLLGSLAAMIVFRKITLVKTPNKLFSRWMRIILGVSLGGAVANSLNGFDYSFAVALVSAVSFVVVVTIFGSYYFSKLPNFSPLDSFMSALPGGLTFLVSMSGELGNKFPKIALIHTVRMTALIICFSIFAFFVGSDTESTEASMQSAFSVPFHYDLWQLLILSLVAGAIATACKIAGGDIMFPMIISSISYGNGWIEVPMPELFNTLAMITFGAVIGCKISAGADSEYSRQIKASLFFTFVAISLALILSLILGDAFNKSYFLFFLALAPGSIPEMCLIALALGYDVGFVALIHTCRYLFIMLIGAIGFHVLNHDQRVKPERSTA